MSGPHSSGPARVRQAALILTLLVLAFSPIVAGRLDAYAQSATACLLLLAGALRVGARWSGGERERVATPLDVPLIVLLGGALLSLPLSVDRHASAVEIIRMLAGLTAFFLAAEVGHDWARGGVPIGEASAPGTPAEPVPARAPSPSGHIRKTKRGRATGGDAPRSLGTWGGAGGRERGNRRPLSLHPGGWAGALWAALAAGAVWAAGSGVQEYLRALREPGQSTWRAFGGFSNPNTLAGHLALTLPLMAAGALALRRRQDMWRAVWLLPAAGFLIGAAGLAFTASRLGTAAAALGLTVFALVALAGQRRLTPWQVAGLALLLLMAGVVAVLAVPTLRLRLVSALTGTEGFSLGFRVTTWIAAVRIFLAHPFTGSGAGTFGAIMLRYSDTSYSQAAHSHLLQTAAETGAMGAAGLVAALVVWFAAVGRQAGRTIAPGVPGDTAPHSRSLFLAAALGGAAASLAHSFAELTWSVPATWWVLWAMLGAAIGASGAARRVATGRVGEGAALAMLLVALPAAWLVAQGAGHTARAAELRDTQPHQAAEQLRQAIRFDPLSPDAHRELGRLLGGLGNYREGAAHLRRATRLAPTTPLNHYHLGLLEMRYGRTDRAVAAFKRAIQWNPHHTYALRQLGGIYRDSRPAETLRIARRLIAIEQSPYGRLHPLAEAQFVDPNYAFAHFWLGEDLDRRGDRASARREYKIAQGILDRHSRSLLGVISLGTGHSIPTPPDLQALRQSIERALARP